VFEINSFFVGLCFSAVVSTYRARLEDSSIKEEEGFSLFGKVLESSLLHLGFVEISGCSWFTDYWGF